MTPSELRRGRGRIDGRPVVVGGDDFSVRGGAADGAIGNKMGWAEKAARDLRFPLVRLVDGTGGGGSVKSHATLRRSYVPALPEWKSRSSCSRRAGRRRGARSGRGPRRRAGRVLAISPVMARDTAPALRRRPAGGAPRLRPRRGQEELGGLPHPHARQRRGRQRGRERGRRARADPALPVLPAEPVYEPPPRLAASDDPRAPRRGAARERARAIGASPTTARGSSRACSIVELLFEIGRASGARSSPGSRASRGGPSA